MQLLRNNVSGVISGSLTSVATSMTLVDATSWPAPGSDDYLATLIGLNVNGQEASWEIVKVTAKAGNTLTIVRGQEGTTPQAWPAATGVQMRLTAGSVPTKGEFDAHVANVSNPHATTKAQVGLGNVENTALSTWAGSASLTTLGTIASGVWNGSVIGSVYGGTGVNNGGRTLAVNTNSGTLAFSNASTTLTIANTASVSGTNTGDQTISLTGDVTGSGTGSFATTLANSGVTAGTYRSVTVDVKGRVTGGTNPTTISGYGITDAYTKTEVDSLVTGLDFKASVRVATTANITLSGTQTIDGIAVVAGDRVLVKDQSVASSNGIYVVAAGAWSRSADADSAAEVTTGMYVFVEDGAVNADSGWVLITNAPIAFGTTALTFAQFNGLGQVTAGAGLTKTGNTLDIVTASSSRIVVNADSIDLATTGVTAGTYRSVTVDVYGRATAGSNPALTNGDIPATLTGKTYEGLTLTSNATGFQIAGGTTSKTLVISSSLTLSGTDGSTLNIGGGGTLGTGAFATIANYLPLTGGALTGGLTSTGGLAGAGLTSEPLGGEGGQLSLKDTTGSFAAYNFDVDSSNHGRLFTTVNNTNLSIGQLTGTGGQVAVFTAGIERLRFDASGRHIYGVGATIQGDFTNAAPGSRLAFQSSTANGITVVTAKPNGTSVASYFNAHNSSDADNSSYVYLGITGTSALLRSDKIGTGAYLPLAVNVGGGDRAIFGISGGLDVATGLREARIAMGANDVDVRSGNYFTKTISGATTLTVSNVPASGTAASFILDLTNGGSATITWWSGMKWAGGAAPTLTSAGRDVLGFFTHDGGTTWTGLVLGKDVK